MNSNKGSGYDYNGRKCVKLASIINPTKINDIITERYENSHKPEYHISKVFMKSKNKKNCPLKSQFRPLACSSALDNPIDKNV